MASTLTTTLKRVIGLNRTIQLPSDHDWSIVTQIQTRLAELERLTDRELTQSSLDLRERSSAAVQSANVTVDAVAHVREAVRRVSGKSYFRVQLLAGLKLSQGFVAEMSTGEGKALTSAIPGFLHSLNHPNVHVATPNAYLAERDFEELRPVYDLLGLKVGLLPEKPSPAKTKAAYQANITYGAGYAFGFDFLRDEQTRRQQPVPALGAATVMGIRGRSIKDLQVLQAGHHCSLIDEIDSVLLDEAMTPLILSIGAKQSGDDHILFRLARRLADQLQIQQDFIISTDRSKLSLTERGLDRADQAIASPSSLSPLEFHLGMRPHQFLKRPWTVYVENALQARHIMKQDVDYTIRDKAIHLIDQKTGRIFSDRSWRGGLHQAVEEYAGVPLSDEKSSAGRITRQSYYQLYSSLCGMTGTAEGAEQEFRQIYGLSTVRIPLNRPTKRVKQSDRFFSSTDAKFDAIIEEALNRHRAGQPVLIGTRTISDSERLSERLKSAAVSHVVLNGKQDQEEALIVAEAGRRGRITVATNMAGRGTDIKPDPAAIEAGGLHVIGVERHESRRIDGQLAGRAARAGAPGSFRFFVSAEDDLIQHNATSMARRWKQQTANRGEIIREFSAQVEQVQIACERAAFHQRQLMIQQDRGMQELLSALCYRTKQ